MFTLKSAILLCLAANPILSVPVPQGAGVGAGCNSILSDTDTSTGLAVENAEDNTASTLSTVTGKAARWVHLYRRQGAGVGAGCDSILSDTDTSTGEAVENAEDNTAATISTPPKMARRQENKIADGLATIVATTGDQSAATTVQDEGDNVDTDSTNDAAQVGADVGQLELDTLPEAGDAVPKARRQENKIADGLSTIVATTGDQSAATTVQDEGDNVDTDSTNDSAQVGADVGQLELDTLPEAGDAVPKL